MVGYKSIAFITIAIVFMDIYKAIKIDLRDEFNKFFLSNHSLVVEMKIDSRKDFINKIFFSNQNLFWKFRKVILF